MSLNVFVDIPIKIVTELDERIAEKFRIFDFFGNGLVAHANLPIVMRWLGCVPSPRDTAELIRKTDIPEFKGATHLSRFLPVFTEMIEAGRMRPVERQGLVDSFRFIDPLGKRYVPADEMEEKVGDGKPDPFTPEEKSTLMHTCIEQPAGVCRYEKFLYKLLIRPVDSIYVQAAELKAARESKDAGRGKAN